MKMPAFPIVIQQAVAVAEFDLAGHSVHGRPWSVGWQVGCRSVSPASRKPFFRSAIVADPAVELAVGLMQEKVRWRGRSRPRRTTSSLCMRSKGRISRNSPPIARLSNSSSMQKKPGVLSGKGFDPRQPSARVEIPRRRHQTAALIVSSKLRPGDQSASSAVSQPGTPFPPGTPAPCSYYRRRSAHRAR